MLKYFSTHCWAATQNRFVTEKEPTANSRGAARPQSPSTPFCAGSARGQPTSCRMMGSFAAMKPSAEGML